MTTPWHPLHLFTHPRRLNRAMVGGVSEDTAPVIAAMCRAGGNDHGFVVAHVGPTTRPQMIVWPMRLTAEKEH